MHDCIVIGCGPSGILAALTLREGGRDVIVLEARNRIGGRTHSKPVSDGSVVERGGQVLHGPTITTWEFVSKLGLKTHLSGSSDSGASALFTDDKWVYEDPVSAEAWKKLDGVLGVPNPDNISLKEALIAAGLRGEILEAAERMCCIGAPMLPEKLSARNASEIHHCFDSFSDPITGVSRTGNPNFRLVDGYSYLWKKMSEPISEFIHLDTPVTKLVWSAGQVEAHTPVGTFEAKTTIVTLPVGVLQSGSLSFEPALPHGKTEAIETFERGPLILVTAEFKHRWWEKIIGNVPNFRGDTKSPFRVGYKFYFADIPGPPVLTAHIGTPDADILTGDQDRISSLFMMDLAEMFPEVDLDSELVDIEVTDWPSDPWTMGGISVVPVGKYHVRADLAAPTPPMFWAGEATHTRGYAECVHGALETGRRAAFEVLHAIQPMRADGTDTPLDWWQYTPSKGPSGLG